MYMKRELILVMVIALVSGFIQANDMNPMPSWNDGPAREAIIKFVSSVTDKNSKDYVSPEKRIATFDNDGALWVEYPVYTQILFAVDRVKKLAPKHPEWKTKQPFKALLEGDMKTAAASGTKGIMEIILATHSGMTSTEFSQEAEKWLTTTKHKKFKRPYAECVYKPQIELLEYLRANGFKTFIVSGGGIEFMRPVSEKAYGIPKEQVIGSSVVSEYKVIDGKPVIVRMPKINFINDRPASP
jgi:phosphoglycolate phosphatase-like HAD superfamily hydrolase